MANLVVTPVFTAGVYQLERTDPVDAGVSGSGLANLQAVQLASRTEYLKSVLDAVGLDLTNTSLVIPALAIASLPPASTNTRKLFFATNANAGAGVVVISNGTNWIDLGTGATVTTSATITVANASDTIAGIVQLATNAEAIAGTNPSKAVTPAALQAKINAIPSLGAATTSTAGTVILATNGEAITGTDAAKAITAAALQAKISAIPSATTSTAGLVPLATAGEALTGTDTTKAITAAALQAKVDTVTAPAATTSTAGIIRVATPAEVRALSANDRTITPLALAGLIPSMSVAAGQFAQVNSAGDAFSYTLQNTTKIVTVAGGTFTALPNRYHFFQAACTVTLPTTPPEGTFIAFFNGLGSGTITLSATGANANGATLGANARAYLVYANFNWRNVGFSGGSFVASGSAAFDYTGSNQTWAVPSGVTTATGLLWAGGGGGGDVVGGGSGFCQATITTTPAENLTIIVGQGGFSLATVGISASPFGGGGTANNRTTSYKFGAGGGRSAIRRSSIELLSAGAGGGGGVEFRVGGDEAGSDGGVGGGTTGGNSLATGGSQSVGGAADNRFSGNATAGALNAGGNGSTTGSGSGVHGGAGGGSGYYGGGGSSLYGGAGGSSFTGSGTTSPTTTSGAGPTAANNTHPNYASGIGNGGSVGNAGGNGRVVILWG